MYMKTRYNHNVIYPIISKSIAFCETAACENPKMMVNILNYTRTYYLASKWQHPYYTTCSSM